MEIYTDGACIPNPGKGGWAFVVIENKEVLFARGGNESESTNNKMELRAILEALKYALSEGLNYFTLYSDSEYCVKVLNGEYGFKKNKELVLEILDLINKLEVNIEWIRGHNGNEGNEAADYLANKAIYGL